MCLEDKLGINRDDFIEYLNQSGIGARPFFYPVSSFPEFNKVGNAISDRLSQYGINLPSNYDLALDDISFIADKIRKYL